MRDGRRSQFSVDQRTCWDERDTKEEMPVFFHSGVVCIASKAWRSRAALLEPSGGNVHERE